MKDEIMEAEGSGEGYRAFWGVVSPLELPHLFVR